MEYCCRRERRGFMDFHDGFNDKIEQMVEIHI